MDTNLPVEVIYVLDVICTIVAIVFFRGKGTMMFRYNTRKKPVFTEDKLCKALGVCFAILAAFLFIVALIWDFYPAWFDYVCWVVIGGDVLAAVIICNLNIIFKN